MPAKLRLRAAPATLAFGALILGLAVSGVIALSGGQARASHVSCGDTITADTTLDSDLVDCPNHGIVIGADDITLDLNGHRIDGDGTPAAGCNPRTEFCDVGVFNDGHDGVTVKRGSVREFAFGVLVLGGRGNRVIDVSSKKNTLFGLVFGDSSHSVIRDSVGKQQHPSRGGRDGRVRLASHPDPAQLVPAQRRTGHPRHGFHPQLDQRQRVLPRPTRTPDRRIRPQPGPSQPLRSWQRGHLGRPATATET